MNYGMIRIVIGWVLQLEGLFMLLPLLVSFIYKESAYKSFLPVIVGALILGTLLKRREPENRNFYLRDGFVSASLTWIVMSAVGAIPFLLSGSITSVVDALFETVSGFTTTGASILPEVESLPKSILFWRSFTHWIGGMGVLVFLLMILPVKGGSSMNLMKAESPGPDVGKFVPKVRATAMILYKIYIVMSIIQFLFLLAGGMNTFDTLTTTFGTAGTGGFGIKNDSMAGYSTYIQVVVTIFMILFGVNFGFYFLIAKKKVKDAFHVEEVWWYLGIIGTAIFVITANIRDLYPTYGKAFQQASFQVGSIITTTGFASADFDLWPAASRTILVMIMFCGACAGSTGGGIKVSRFAILLKTIKKELYQILHTRSVKRIKLGGKVVDNEVLRSTNVFMITYTVIFAFSVLALAFDGKDLVTNFTAVTATLNNIGPGLELVGPSANFGVFSSGAKWVFIFDMLAGRLELFPLLLLFMPETWKKN